MSKKLGDAISRRDVLKGAGAVAAGAAVGMLPATDAAAAAKAPRWAMVMDLRRCTGCRGCTVACKSEYDTPLGRWNAVIHEVEYGTYPNTKKVFLPLMCNHCEGNKKDKVPPCVKICPEWPGERKVYVSPQGKKIRYRYGATYKRPDGMILFDNDLCIGCGKCIKECPYGVRSFNPMVKAGKAPKDEHGITKCTMCQHRVDQGLEPACVNTCEGSARIFGDMNDPNSEVAKLIAKHGLLQNKDKTTLLPDEHTDPHVFYIDPDNILARVYTKGQPYVDQIK